MPEHGADGVDSSFMGSGSDTSELWSSGVLHEDLIPTLTTCSPHASAVHQQELLRSLQSVSSRRARESVRPTEVGSTRWSDGTVATCGPMATSSAGRARAGRLAVA